MWHIYNIKYITMKTAYDTKITKNSIIWWSIKLLLQDVTRKQTSLEATVLPARKSAWGYPVISWFNFWANVFQFVTGIGCIIW